MTASQQLLAEYVTHGSEEAFRELVRCYLDLVYSTALRLVGGDAQLAEDVAQTVFADLARKARTLPGDLMLGGWLHRHTCFVSSKLMRSERRRQSRERQAVEMNAVPDHSEENLARVMPVLDDAINELGAEDRLAILLRFFERRDLRSVGEALGSSENAAGKRVTRAVDTLRASLVRRGVVLSGAALGAGLAAQAVSAAPAGLLASISASVATGAAAGTGTTATLLKFMTLNKLQVGIISAVAAAGVVVPIALDHQTGLRAENRALLQQLEGSSETTVAPAAAGPMVNATTADGAAERAAEISRLRAELDRLQQQLAEMRHPTNAARLWAEAQERATADAIRSGLLLTPEELQAGFPKEAWVFSGYETPKAAMQSLMWAQSQGDINALFRGYTSNALEVKFGWQWKGMTEAEVADYVRNSMSGIVHFEGAGQRPGLLSAGESMDGSRVVFTFVPITADGERLRTINFSLEKVDGEWKSVNRRGPLREQARGQP